MLQGIQLLLVDDDEIDIMSFERMLKRTGLPCELHTCTSAENAVIIISEKKLDAIFLDYLLPGTDGLALIKKIRGMEVSTPIAVLTSQGDEKLAVEIMKAGAFDYFPKSDVDPDRLSRTITTALRINAVEREKEQVQQELVENNNKLSAIIESTGNLIFAVDEHLIITAGNASFFQTIEKGYQYKAKVGSSIMEIFKNGRSYTRMEELFTRALSGLGFRDVEEIGNPFIHTQYFELHFNPVFDAKGGVKGVAVFAQDLSEKKKAEREVLEAKFEAENKARARSEFLSNMSHEIRTPMNAIIGLSELLLKEKLTEKQLKNIQSIKYSADNLLVIINDILDFSKIESGKVEFENIPFNLRSLLEEISKTFQFKADEKNLWFKLEVDNQIPVEMKGDPFRLNQIILNLVSNALKFTKEGGVTIKAECLRDTHNMLDLRISVIDTGIGIPQDKLESVFESYTQAYADTSRKFGGTGLGLAITKRLVMLQNGHIDLSSELGKGTTFAVHIPFMKCEQNIITETPHKDDVFDLKGISILLVEDNEINQMVAGQILGMWNVQIDFADNGLIATDKLKEHDYDVVLMDLQMPVMSGYEATAYIRDKTNGVRNPDVPIIALTADAFPETRKKVLEQGMNDFVTKPLEQNELYHKIKSWVLRLQTA